MRSPGRKGTARWEAKKGSYQTELKCRLLSGSLEPSGWSHYYRILTSPSACLLSVPGDQETGDKQCYLRRLSGG
jgi:hypothetical protein